MMSIENAIDELDYLMIKVSKVHGDNHPELLKIKDCYLSIKAALFKNDKNKVIDEIKKASALSNDFEIPSDACEAYTRVYKAFKALEENYKCQ